MRIYTAQPDPQQERRTRLACTALAVACLLAAVPCGIAHHEIPERDAVISWERLGLPSPELMARLILVESGGDPYAVSARGARGLCQLMPGLVRSLGGDPARLYDAEYNAMFAARWLGVLIQRYGVDGALRAYNVGENPSKRHLWHSPAVEEYVRRVRG